MICSFSCNKDVTLISGKITDSFTGSSLAGVSITTIPAISTPITTDASGNYTISEISAGNYKLNLSQDRYVPDTVSCSVSKGAASTVNVSLNTVIGGTWSVSIPDGYTFQFKQDGSYIGSDGTGTWTMASLTTGIVTWTFNYGGSPITYYGRMTSSTTMAGINVSWTATRH